MGSKCELEGTLTNGGASRPYNETSAIPHQLLRDTIFALRTLRRDSWSVIFAVLTLAIGIGASIAMFAVANQVLYRPMMFPGAQRIVAVNAEPFERGIPQPMPWLTYQDLAARSHTVEAIAGFYLENVVASLPYGTKEVMSMRVTASIFEALQIKPALGRAFIGSDNDPGAAPVAILSEELWRAEFDRSPLAIGHFVRIGSSLYRIVGIMPKDATFPPQQAKMKFGIWLPIQPSPAMLADRNVSITYAIGRLASGCSLAGAQAELQSIAVNMRENSPSLGPKFSFGIVPYRNVISSEVRAPLKALLVVVLLVLFVASSNVAGMYLARLLARRPEFALRISLGAGQWTIIRQILTEVAVITFLGSIGGGCVAWGLICIVQKTLPGVLPTVENIHIPPSLFVLFLGIAFATTIVTALPACLSILRTSPERILREAGRTAAGGAHRSRSAAVLIVCETIVAVLLLTATGLVLRTLNALNRVTLGFDSDRIIALAAVPASSQSISNFAKKIGDSVNEAPKTSVPPPAYLATVELLRKIPGVTDVAVASSVPLDGIHLTSTYSVPGAAQAGLPKTLEVRAVSPGFSRLLGIGLREGRMINDGDEINTLPVAVINEALARESFPFVHPLGQRIMVDGFDKPFIVIGVINNTTQHIVGKSPEPEVDISYSQIPVESAFRPILVESFATYLVKVHSEADANSIRVAFGKIAPDYAIDDLTTLRQARSRATQNQRISAVLVSTFATIAIALVIAGLYGILAQVMSDRQREVAIRMALGETRYSVVSSVINRSVGLVVIGIAIGLPLAAGFSKVIKGYLFGVSHLDVITYLGVIVTMISVGVIAALIPATRAAMTNICELLRSE